MADFPNPPIPTSVDLRGFPYMPLDVVRLRDSEIAVKTKGDEFRCAVLLWCAAWHQLPAASLPDDDCVLADLAGFGRVVKEWRKVRAGALRGFVKCSDGRLYHAVVVEKAIEAWRAQLTQRWKSECSRLKKAAQRKKIKDPDLPEFDLWITSECPEFLPFMSRGTQQEVPEDKLPMSQGQPHNVPKETLSKRSEGNGRDSPSTSTLPEKESASTAVDNPEPPGINPTSKQEASTSTFRTASDAAERVLAQYRGRKAAAA